MNGLQEVYEELRSDVYELRKLKEQRRERYASIFPGAIDYSKEKVQTSASNPMEGWIADLDQLDQKIAQHEAALEEKRQRYIKEYGLEAEPVIKAHYIDLIPWEKSVPHSESLARPYTGEEKSMKNREKQRKTEKTRENSLILKHYFYTISYR